MPSDLRFLPFALCFALLAGCDLEPLPDPPSGALVSLVPSGADWRYLDDGSDPGLGWELLNFFTTFS